MPRPNLGHIADTKIKLNLMGGSDWYMSSRTIEEVGRPGTCSAVPLVRFGSWPNHRYVPAQYTLSRTYGEGSARFVLYYSAGDLDGTGEATKLADAGMTGIDNGRGTSLPPFPETLEALHRAAHS